MKIWARVGMTIEMTENQYNAFINEGTPHLRTGILISCIAERRFNLDGNSIIYDENGEELFEVEV